MKTIINAYGNYELGVNGITKARAFSLEAENANEEILLAEIVKAVVEELNDRYNERGSELVVPKPPQSSNLN